jgi:hypothetical protein
VKCVAVVIEGEGFTAAVHRSVISGMRLFLSHRPPKNAFADVGGAVTWMRKFVDIAGPLQLISAVEEFRALLPKRAKD